jgi:hypothetical protein
MTVLSFCGKKIILFSRDVKLKSKVDKLFKWSTMGE